MRRCLLLSIGLSLLVSVAPTPAAQQTQQTPSLDYELFKTRVEPIFLARRPGHARCYACHALGAGEGNAPNAMRLQLLSPGSTTWNEDQSRKNFEAVRQKVVPPVMTAPVVSSIWWSLSCVKDTRTRMC